MRNIDGSNVKTLVVITGPTASGKSDAAIEVAKALCCPIISADSRQMYREIPIGTSAPTPKQLQEIQHYFVGNLEMEDYYSASKFEEECIRTLQEIWSNPASSKYVVMCGGSMMYIDAVCNGIDDMPTVSETTRAYVTRLYDEYGQEGLLAQLQILDPKYAAQVDKNNLRRLMHAIEICLQSGKPYSEMRVGRKKERTFRIVKFAINMPREELFQRINRRVEKMIEDGLVEEAQRVFQLYSDKLNSLNTVGYRELVPYFNGKISLSDAIAKIQKNTRVYAKKQLTWLKKDTEVNWIDSHKDIPQEILKTIWI